MSLGAIAYISAEILVGVITITGNSIVLVSIIWTKSLHNITNVFIGNLAMADIAVGIVVPPCATMSFLGLPRDNKYGCILLNCILLSSTNISILMILTIAVDRFVAIRFPFKYKEHATIKCAILVNLSIWVIGSIAGLLPMFGWNIAPDNISECKFSNTLSIKFLIYFQFFIITLLPLFIMFSIYLYIFLIVRRHSKHITMLGNQFQNQHYPSHRRWMKDVQVAKMFAKFLLFFSFFWLPINIMNSLKLFCPTCRLPFEVVLTAVVLSHVNSSVNPFLYAANSTSIKIAMKHVFLSKGSLQFESTSVGFTSYQVKASKQHQNTNFSRITSKELRSQNIDEQRDNIYVTKKNEMAVYNTTQAMRQHNMAVNAVSYTTTRVSFLAKPFTADCTNEGDVIEHSMEKYRLRQTHSLGDQIHRNNALDENKLVEDMTNIGTAV